MQKRGSQATRGRTKENTSANLGFEAKLWQAADALRNNMDAAEYKHVVLSLIFPSTSPTRSRPSTPNSKPSQRKNWRTVWASRASTFSRCAQLKNRVTFLR